MNNEKYNGIGNCYPFKSRYWETKDHHIIKISDMETSHIENTINFLQRTKDFYDEGGGCYWDPDTFYYDDNSYLVDIKIEELKEELKKRQEEEVSWS